MGGSGEQKEKGEQEEQGKQEERGNRGKKEQQEWCWSVNTLSTVRGKTNRIIYVSVYRNTINDGDSQTSLSLIFSQGRWGVCAQAI